MKNEKTVINYSVVDKAGHEETIGGTVFDQNNIKINSLSGFSFEMNPTGKIIIVRNNAVVNM